MTPFDILRFNFEWMTWNIFLAIIPVVFGRWMVKGKTNIKRILAGFVWFFFLPNSIYLLTDPINLFKDARFLTGIYLMLDIILFAILLPIGVVTYIISMGYFERMLNKVKDKILKHSIIFILNSLVAFGVVLGRFQRVNSWEVITDIPNVIEKSLGILASPSLMSWVIFFVICFEIVYYYFGSFERLRQRVIAA